MRHVAQIIAAAIALAASVVLANGATIAEGARNSTPNVNCTCRYRGQDFHLGDSVCLPTSNGLRLAQCQMVLNNTSWQITDWPCPSAAAPKHRGKAVLAGVRPVSRPVTSPGQSRRTTSKAMQIRFQSEVNGIVRWYM